ncbi:MAG: single-stranded DNA-binding protein [Rubrivivax sp.]|nr:single-stranded DNA-binding protein [Rubrivivax sp.]MDZ4372069.1 single-stranded DNA-binding protein [Phenylobacterium sp.]
MINQVTLVGNLGADPETRALNDGGQVTNIRVATTETWKDRETGAKREKTEWHRVSIWGEPSAKYLAYAQKGTKVYVQGKLTTRKWTDQNGVERYSTEITVNEIDGVKILDGGRPREGQEQPQTQAPRSRSNSRSRQKPAEQPNYDLTDDIPF